MSDEGVWDRHFAIRLSEQGEFLLEACAPAFAAVNGKPVSGARLRPGDLIEAGGSKMLFWLSQTRQTGLLLREVLTWVALGLLCAAQMAIIYWLVQ